MKQDFFSKPWITPVLLALVTLAFGIAPALTPPFTGYDPAMFPTVIERPSIQPAGYAFAIWGLIYLWLGLHALFGLIFRRTDPAWDATRAPAILAIGTGAVWLAIANDYPLTATVGIWIMQAAALTAFLRADPARDRWLLSAPLAILAGWLTAAAAVSTGVVIAGYGILSDTGSALAMLALVLAITLTAQSRRPQMPVYILTVIWALGGIIAVNWAANPVVAYAAMAGVVIVGAPLLARLLRL